jgi:hypothetical protein
MIRDMFSGALRLRYQLALFWFAALLGLSVKAQSPEPLYDEARVPAYAARSIRHE